MKLSFKPGDRVSLKRRLGQKFETCFGTVEGVGPTGLIRVNLDSGQTYSYEPRELTREINQ